MSSFQDQAACLSNLKNRMTFLDQSRGTFEATLTTTANQTAMHLDSLSVGATGIGATGFGVTMNAERRVVFAGAGPELVIEYMFKTHHQGEDCPL